MRIRPQILQRVYLDLQYLILLELKFHSFELVYVVGEEKVDLLSPYRQRKFSLEGDYYRRLLCKGPFPLLVRFLL